MKTVYYMIMMCVVALVASGCHSDLEDYTTGGEIVLTLPQEGTIETLQYSVMMVNLNSRNVTTFSDITASGHIIVDNIMRGAYSVSVEGIVRIKDATSQLSTHQFRAQSDYVSMAATDGGNTVTLEMILID